MRIYFRIALALMAGAIFFSCEKDLGEVGIDTLPNEKFMQVYVDTSKDLSFSIVNDNTVSDTLPMVGSYIDPIFGKTSSEFIAPFFIDLAKFSKDTAELLKRDANTKVQISFVIGNTYYGKSDLNRLHLNIYALNTDIYEDYSSDTISLDYLDSLLIHNGDFLFSYSDDNPNEYLEKDTITFSITGEAKDLLLRRIFCNEYSNIDTLFKVNNNIRRESFPGLLFTFSEDNSDEMIYHISNPRITIENYGLAMTLSTYDGEYNIFKHDYSTSPFSVGDTNANKLYIQSMQGLKGKIKFNNLDHWADSSNIAFNRVSLKLPIDIVASDTTEYPIPTQIQIRITGPGTDGDTLDSKFTSIHIESSKYESLVKDGNNLYYTFMIKEFFTFYHYFKNFDATSKDVTLSDYNIEVYALKNNAQPHRVVLDCKSGSTKANIEIIYTKY